MFFNVYFIGTGSRARHNSPSQKSGTKTHPKNHPTDRDLMPAAGDAFSCPSKEVASGLERAYRGAGTSLLPANPCFEGRI
jgi:hypothetical protein